MDLTQQVTPRAVAVHAVKAGAAPGCRPHIAVAVGANAVGAARAHLDKHPPVDRCGPVHVEHPDVTDVNYIQPRLVGGEANAVWSVHLSDHRRSLPGVGIDAVDVTGKFLDGLLTLVVAFDSPARVGEPHRPVGVHGDVVGGVQRLSLVAVYQDRDGAVVFCPSDASGQVLAGHESPLPVSGVAVAVVRRLTKYRHLAGDLTPTEHPVVRDVGEQQVPPVAEPHRTLQPAATGPQPLHDLLPDHERAETLVDKLDSRVWKPHNSSVVLPCAGTGSTFRHMLNLGR